MSKLPNVTWLKSFEAAARSGSFSAAADELGLTPAAVSQQIKLLEQHLGVQLFRRLPRGVALTDVGHAFAQPIRRSFADMREAATSLFGAREKRTVRIRASISYAAWVLAPKLTAFREAFPNTNLEVSTTIWSDRIADQAIDAEIRYGYGDWEERDIRHLGHLFAEVVCHPTLAAAFGDELSIEALAAHAVLIIGSETDWRRAAVDLGFHLPPMAHAMKVDSSLVALQIISAGAGSAFVCEDFARPYVRQGLLASPFDYRLMLPRSFFLVVQDNAPPRPEVRQFCDWISGLHRSDERLGG